jgi:hypothetical protein
METVCNRFRQPLKLPKTICNCLWKRYVTACLVTYPVMQPLMEMVCNRLWKWRLTNYSHGTRSVLGCCNNTVSISGDDWLRTISISGYQMLGAHKSVRQCKTVSYLTNYVTSYAMSYATSYATAGSYLADRPTSV